MPVGGSEQHTQVGLQGKSPVPTGRRTTFQHGEQRVRPSEAILPGTVLLENGCQAAAGAIEPTSDYAQTEPEAAVNLDLLLGPGLH